MNATLTIESELADRKTFLPKLLCFRYLLRVVIPDLRALQQGDKDAWHDAYSYLYPFAFGAAQQKLSNFPADIPDVAIEAIEELTDKVNGLESAEMLKPMVICIASRLAISHIRTLMAQKRGTGKVESLHQQGDDDEPIDPPDPAGALDTLHNNELAALLLGLQKDLKAEWYDVLQDYFYEHLKYEDIAKKRNLALGSVGVYLKRALGVLQNKLREKPKLQQELEKFLCCLFCI
jgi:RNA polymerase sigma factor (sigma-70 family)